MENDLGMTDEQYILALSMFFIPYALFEVSIPCLLLKNLAQVSVQPVSNVFLKKLKPSIWLSSMMFLWGTVMVRRNHVNQASIIDLLTIQNTRPFMESSEISKRFSVSCGIFLSLEKSSFTLDETAVKF